jgi:hypothetical protein
MQVGREVPKSRHFDQDSVRRLFWLEHTSTRLSPAAQSRRRVTGLAAVPVAPGLTILREKWSCFISAIRPDTDLRRLVD